MTKLESRLTRQVGELNTAVQRSAIVIEELQSALVDRDTKIAELQSTLQEAQTQTDQPANGSMRAHAPH